jgi:hypothetical protein
MLKILGTTIHTIKKNREALVVINKEIGLEVNAHETKYFVVSQDQNALRSQNVKIVNSLFERAEEFKYLGTILTNQNSIQKEIQRRLKSGNSCYHSVNNLLYSSLLNKNLKKRYTEL